MRANATPIVASEAPNEWLIGEVSWPKSAAVNATIAAAADAVAMNAAWSGLKATGGRPTTGFGGGGSGRFSSAARSVAMACARTRRCAMPTSGRKNHPKNGMSISPLDSTSASVPGSPPDESVMRSATDGWRSGGPSISNVPAAPDGTAPRRSTAAARTSSDRAASRTSEDRATCGMLRAQPRTLSEGHMTKLAVGDKAPAFTLEDQNGKKVKLADAKGKRVVVYFYPKADTPGCTTQSCNLRDAVPQLKKLKAVVYGISPDPPAKQKKFDDKYGLGFPLLADTEHKVAESFGVWGEKSLYGRKFMGIVRSAFVIDEKGKLAGVFYKVSPKDTVPLVQATLEAL